MTAAAARSGDWLEEFNTKSGREAILDLLTVCSSHRWAERVASTRPFAAAEDLERAADQIWLALEPEDWLEALAGHPRIGEQGGSSEAHSEHEQAGIVGSTTSIVEALREGNQRYEARFGHVFLISAAGKGAEEILSELTRRVDNAPEVELREAAEQHRLITRLRLRRMIEESGAAS